MRIIWLIILPLLLGSIESNVAAQLIPRRSTTRPCPTYKLPQANYQVDDRSRSATAFSFRFVFLDNPLDELNQQSIAGLNEKTEITTVTTEKSVSNGASNSGGLFGTATGIATDITDAITSIDNARLRAQGRFLASGMTTADISASIQAIDNARLLAQEKLLQSGKTAGDISTAITAIDFAKLLAQEKLLKSGKTSKDLSKAIAAIEAERLIAQEKLLKSGKVSAFEEAQLRAQKALLTPGKTEDKITKKTQIFDSSAGSESATIDRDRKLFQWKENQLQIDHCEISNIAVQLSREGEWKLNLRADQNRVVAGNRFNPNLFIKRNQFGIVLRCYGNMATSRTVSSSTVGQPVLAELKVEKFWVQNGRPNFFVTSQNEPLVAQNFELIDRVEIEFFYYK